MIVGAVTKKEATAGEPLVHASMAKEDADSIVVDWASGLTTAHARNAVVAILAAWIDRAINRGGKSPDDAYWDAVELVDEARDAATSEAI